MKNCILILSISASQPPLQAQELNTVTYGDGNQKLHGIITSNADQQLPGVLILPAWKGIDNEAKATAIKLEKEGYIAFIADIYGEGNVPKDKQQAAQQSSQYKKDYQAYQRRIRLALEQLKKSGVSKIAVIGYCFGGAGALEAARGGMEVSGIVSIHGSYAITDDRKDHSITAKVLIEHAADDQSTTKEELDDLVKELNDAEADWQIIIYANSGHTFTNPESADYNPVMAERAWKHTLLFLQEVLK